jgi:hypothetical protein
VLLAQVADADHSQPQPRHALVSFPVMVGWLGGFFL